MNEEFRHARHFDPDAEAGEDLASIHRYQMMMMSMVVGLFWNDLQVSQNAISVLDVGASDGWLGKKFDFAAYTAIDPHPRDESVRRAELEDLAAQKVHYDLMVFCHVLEHLAHPMRTLQLARRLTRTIWIAVPHSEAQWSWEYGGHLWQFNEVTLPRVLEHAGFSTSHVLRVNFRGDREEVWAWAR